MGANVVLTLNAFNGVPPYTWRLASGSSLPPGLQLVDANAASTNFLPATTSSPGIANHAWRVSVSI